MSTTQSWWKRFLGGAEKKLEGVAETPAPPFSPYYLLPPVTCAIVRRDGIFEMVKMTSPQKGVRVVAMPVEMMDAYYEVAENYCEARRQWSIMQDRLASLPFKYRPRKRKLKIVSLPPNPEPAEVTG